MHARYPVGPLALFSRVSVALVVAFIGAVAALTAILLAPPSTPAASFQGRSYELYVPPGAKTPLPAVFVLHGGGGTGRLLQHYSRFDHWAKAYNVVAVYPNGVSSLWNDGRRWEGPKRTDANDVQYLLDLKHALASQGIIHPNWVYFMGISNGGGMAMRMACQVPNEVSGIGVIATKQLMAQDCSRRQPVPTVFFYGTDDKLSPPGGRPNGRIGKRFLGKTYSAAKTLNMWDLNNGCGKRVFHRTLDAKPHDGTVVRHYVYQNCRQPLEYFEIVKGGHSWPGARPHAPMGKLRKYLIGTTTQEINAGQEALRIWLGTPPPPPSSPQLSH